MKHNLLPLSLLYFSCAAPPQPASPVIVELQTLKYSYSREQKHEESAQEEELSLERKIRKVIKYLKKLPPGNIYVRNGSGHFAYSYGASKYCVDRPHYREENMQKYNALITLTYSRITLFEVVLFDIPPLGSVDGILLVTLKRIGEEGPMADFHHASEPAQKFYETMLISLHQELQQHFSKGRHWKSFGAEREIDDPEKKLEKAYEGLMEDLKPKNPTPQEEVEFLAPCKD